MTIQLPKDVESFINAEVHRGHFASVDDAVTAIVREYFQREEKASPAATSGIKPDPGLGSIGAMRDAADELDAITADAMSRRQGQPTPEQENAAVAPAPLDRKPIWERVAELRKSVPVEEWDKLPIDGAEQLDHYIYGSPKRPTP
jgi:Arc/MetJ-type ribon-helix-helix transcriptional regulator